MKKCILVGMGMGSIDSLTIQARAAIENAPVVAGASRMLSSVSPLIKGAQFQSYAANQIAAAFEEYADAGVPCAVFSGDTGFYSGAQALHALLNENGWEVTVYAGITTVQYFASKLGLSWQDWHLASAHGTNCNLGIALSYKSQTFFLTGGSITVRTIAQFLVQQGFESAVLFVGSRLSYPDEVIFSGTAQEVLQRDAFDEQLSCVLVQLESACPHEKALPDAFFVRNAPNEALVPMTKQLVRSAILSLLAPGNGETVWDVGAGTGSVSIALSRAAHCAVYAVEENEGACALIKTNRKKAGCVNLSVVCGRAPDALSELPAPDAVFVGGSNGELSAILCAVRERNAQARILVSCITMETLSEVQAAARLLNFDYSCVQLSVNQAERAGRYHLIKPQTPVWLVQLTAVA